MERWIINKKRRRKNTHKTQNIDTRAGYTLQWSDWRLSSCIIQEPGWLGLYPEACVNTVNLLYTLRNGCLLKGCVSQLPRNSTSRSAWRSDSFHIRTVKRQGQMRALASVSQKRANRCLASIIAVLFFFFYTSQCTQIYNAVPAMTQCVVPIPPHPTPLKKQTPAKRRHATLKTEPLITFIIA